MSYMIEYNNEQEWNSIYMALVELGLYYFDEESDDAIFVGAFYVDTELQGEYDYLERAKKG